MMMTIRNNSDNDADDDKGDNDNDAKSALFGFRPSYNLSA